MKRFFGSAERPAGGSPDFDADRSVEPAEYMMMRSGNAALPTGYSEFHRLAFYNIGWNLLSQKAWHTMDGLATEICDMVHDKCVDAVGICEVLNLSRGICEVLNLRDDSYWQQRQDIMKHVVWKLNSRAEQPATSADNSAQQPAWKGQSDGHYIFAWNSNRLVLTSYEYISCGIAEHPWRMAQYLQFEPAQSHYHSRVSLHVCHNHSPASKNGKLTDERAKRIFATLWDHVMNNAHDERIDSAVQPVAIFGGDFNCSPLAWAECLQHAMATQASRRSVQVCSSKATPRCVGDVALVFNARAAQEDSGWGKTHIRTFKPPPFSDAHDVVLVPFCWTRRVLLSTSNAQVRGVTTARTAKIRKTS